MQLSFFSKKQVTSVSSPDGKTYSCARCGLYKNGIHPKLPPQGSGKMSIMNIGIAPTVYSDEKGKVWEKPHEKLLRPIFNSHDIDLYEDCRNLHACRCLPLYPDKSTRMPTNKEIISCRSWVLKYAKKIKPKIIFTYGEKPLYSLIGHKFTKRFGNIHKWRGLLIPDRELNCWIAPVFDLCLVLKHNSADKSEALTVFNQDMHHALDNYNKPFPDISILNRIQYPDTAQGIALFKSLLIDKTPRLLSFDYETTGLKPYLKEMGNICVGICDGKTAFAIMLDHRKIRRLLKKVLEAPHLYKTAHNMKYEKIWSKYTLDTQVKPWAIDTMLSSHIIDNRPGICRLKFQGYVNLGILGYDDDIKPFLKSKEKGSNSLNDIKKGIQAIGPRAVLSYCATDAIIGYKIAQIHLPQIGILKNEFSY